MENQSGHPDQLGMADQGLRPFTSLLLSTPSMAQHAAGSSVNVATIQMPTQPSHPIYGGLLSKPSMAQHAAGSSVNVATIQMPTQPSHPTYGGLLSKPSMAQHAAGSSVNVATIQMPTQPSHPTYGGYSWMKCGQHTIPVGDAKVIYYKCNQANCGVKKSMVFSAGGQIIETVFRGSHNHSRLSGIRPGSQDYTLPEAFAAGTCRLGQRDDQLPSSSESEEDDYGEAGVNEYFDGDTSAAERHVQAPAERITMQTGSGNSRQNERRSKSKVWDEFTAVLEGGKIHSAECNHCKKCLSGKSTGGTSHLRRHLKICPAQPGIVRLHQQKSASHPDTSIRSHLKLDQDKSLELLTKALVSNLCSFSLVSSTNFRQFMAAICPTYGAVTQGAVGEKFIGIFQHEKLKLKEKIALTPGGVFLTVGNWDLRFKNFICVTVHFIDKDWRLNRKMIKCCFSGNEIEIDDEHYFGMFPDWASYLKRRVHVNEKSIIKEAIQDWSLEHKLLGILPGSVDDAAILNLEKNLTGQNYLLAKWKLLTLPSMIGLLHNLIYIYGTTKEFVDKTCPYWFEYMTCTPLRADKYKEILSQLHLNKPSFGSQQWYFPYYLLEAALLFNKALPNPGLLDSKLYPSKPSCEQLAATENFCDIVRQIYHAVKLISGPRYETLNSYFHPIWSLKIALMNLSRKANIDQVFHVEEMQETFDKLWRKWYLWLSLAVVLDPRYKISFLDFCFKLAFGSDARRYILQVRGKMYELFLQYSFYVDQQSGEHLNQRNDNLQFDGHGRLPVHDTSQSYIEQSAHEELGELIAYLEGDVIPQNVPFDILKWWKGNASTYPTLARLARDILALPGSAVSAESAFDETDERALLFDKKISLEVVEALICTQDWIKSSDIVDEDGETRNISA